MYLTYITVTTYTVMVTKHILASSGGIKYSNKIQISIHIHKIRVKCVLKY